MKMSIRVATLNLQKPYSSARIAPWLAVTTCWLMSRLLQIIKFVGVRNNEMTLMDKNCPIKKSFVTIVKHISWCQVGKHCSFRIVFMQLFEL
jgi:hypothetical protein